MTAKEYKSTVKEYIDSTIEIVNKAYSSGKHNFEIDNKADTRKKVKAICMSQKNGCADCPIADHRNSVCRWEVIKDTYENSDK